MGCGRATTRVRKSKAIIDFLKKIVDFLREWVPVAGCGRGARQSREIINFLKEGIDFLREWVPAAGYGRVIIAVVVVRRIAAEYGTDQFP